MTVAVIIPYFQTRAGILRRALKSVLEQRLPADASVEIIVVDDGSPVSAKAETATLTVPLPYSLTIVEQPNGGVAAARNVALRHVTERTAYIAFLDSDDMWHPDHLPTALAALNAGADFYFCDSQRVGLPYTAFSEKSFADFIREHGKDFGDGLHELDHKTFFDQSIRGRVFLTPAVVYRRAVAPDLMFDPTLRVAGEDCLFFFQLIGKSRRVCCSPRLLVTCGEGVNIHAGKYGWDDPGHLIRHMGQLLACYRWRQKLQFSPEQDRFILARIKRLRGLFAFLTIRYFLKKRELWPQELRDMVHADPHFAWWYPAYAAYVSICFPLRLYDPLRNW